MSALWRIYVRQKKLLKFRYKKCLLTNMKPISLLLLLFIAFIFSGCANKHGISLKYYSECQEYYDLQGYYHKKCGDDDIITYKQINKALHKKKPKPKGNVW